MSEEKREAKNEWITVKNKSAKFWATANDLGLTKDETHNALNFVESAYDFTGALDEALSLLAAYAELKARAVEKVTEAAQGNALFDAISQLPEAPMVAWTHFQKKPGSPTWSFTVRPELSPELADVLMKETFRQISNLEKWLDANDFRPVYRSNEMAAVPVPAPTQETTQQSNQETTQQQSTQTTQNGTKELGAQQFEDIDRISIRGSKTKPKVEFWRNGRQYAELYWNQGGKYLLEKAPVLATIPVQIMLGDKQEAHAGLTAEMLDDVGSDYAVSLKVYWVQSPKNPKWKDIAGAVAR